MNANFASNQAAREGPTSQTRSSHYVLSEIFVGFFFFFFVVVFFPQERVVSARGEKGAKGERRNLKQAPRSAWSLMQGSIP